MDNDAMARGTPLAVAARLGVGRNDRLAILGHTLAIDFAVTVGTMITNLRTAEGQRPYTCRLLDDEQRKCAFGSCDKRVIERQGHERLHDGGQP